MGNLDQAAASQGNTKPARKATPELSAMIQTLMDEGHLKLAPTLGEIRAALQTEGATWSREGELLFPQDRTALVIEIDELIDAYGAAANASDLVARRMSG